MINEEERIAHLSGRWATSYPPFRNDVIPSVFPAKAGIHVGPLFLYTRELP